MNYGRTSFLGALAALAPAALALVVGCGSPPPPPPPPPPPATPVVVAPPPPVVVPTKVDLDLVGAQLNIKTDIEFDVAKATIRDNHNSQVTLNAVLQILTRAPQITRLRIEGHTDSDGNPQDNQVLSQNRANAVRDWLAGHGINPARLATAGCAARDPLVPNDTPEHKQRNRRTEFDIERIGDAPPPNYTEPCAPNKQR